MPCVIRVTVEGEPPRYSAYNSLRTVKTLVASLDEARVYVSDTTAAKSIEYVRRHLPAGFDHAHIDVLEVRVIEAGLLSQSAATSSSAPEEGVPSSSEDLQTVLQSVKAGLQDVRIQALFANMARLLECFDAFISKVPE